MMELLYYMADVFFVLLVAYLSLAVTYSLLLALLSCCLPRKKLVSAGGYRKFAIVIPAHNEELNFDKLGNNLKELNYEKNHYAVFVVADNCTDNTAAIARNFDFNVLVRDNQEQRGKGYALQYALQSIALSDYDAVLIIDADTHVKADILLELNKLLVCGEVAIQCYIAVPNDNESWFTRLISVARVMNGVFYHQPKFRLGLSSYLMGSGICLATSLLKAKGWTAFSIAEDWEYYAQLLLDGYRIAFAREAVVYQYESRSLEQATSQRLRWSSGRWGVTKSLGLKLLAEGLKKRNLTVFDAALPLIFPNYSLQVNLSLLALALGLLLPPSAWKGYFTVQVFLLLAVQLLLFLAGTLIAGSPGRTLLAMLRAPLFLLWKSVIDIACFTGIYRGEKWIRTKRHRI